MRLRYGGSASTWGFALYLASTDEYQDAILPTSGFAGNLGRDTYIGPGLATWDLSVVKDTRIHERATLQFRAEIFNVLNWTNFANPTTTFNSGSFGTITSTRNGGGAPGLGFGEPRSVQLALKLLW